MARQQVQMGVGFTPGMRAALQKAADNAGISVAEEIRRRVTVSFAKEAKWTPIQSLVDAVGRFAELIKQRTARDWSDDRAAATMLRTAIDAHLVRRYGAQPNDGSEGDIGREIEAADYAAVKSLEASITAIDLSIRNLQQSLPRAGARREQIEQSLNSLTQERDRLRTLLKVPPDATSAAPPQSDDESNSQPRIP
jgi:hypothetical protein